MIPKKILVPTDFSDTAAHGTRYAFELAQALGAQVSLLHVRVLPVPPEAGGMASDFANETEQEARKKLEQVAASYRVNSPLVASLVTTGEPSAGIVQIAREIAADLIVIGTHGRRGVRRLLLGSVAESVLRVAPCPVLAVRLPGEPER
jgi:nucleotide-binding universal stress UspA family protein